MKKSKLWSLLLTFGAIGLAIGGANLKHAPNVFAHHEDHLTHEVEGHSKVRPTLTPKELVTPPGAVAISTKKDFTDFFNNTGAFSGTSAYLANDIDLEGTVFGIGVHGDYSGIFEGNGFTVTNFKSSKLFYFVHPNGIIRNLNLRHLVDGFSSGLCLKNNGTIQNVKIEILAETKVEHVGGFCYEGNAGTLTDSEVDFIFSGAGQESVTALNAITAVLGAGTVTNVSYYVSGIESSKVAAQGATLRSEPIDWGVSELPPSVSVVSGYVNKIYVEEEPSSTEITAQVLNSEATRIWSIAELNGETFASVEVDEAGVATVTALAKGNVTFKFKATIDGVDYLSTLVTIKVLNNSTDYDIPENAYQISTASQFKTYFNAATYASTNGVLLNDIDLGGDTVVGMAGEFGGIFEGQGFKVSNYKGRALFNIVKANSEVRNFEIDFEVTFGASGAIAAINNGLIKNVKVRATVKTGINAYGGISQVGSGQFVDCHVDWIISNSEANTLHAIVEADSGKSITNCSWTMNGSTTAVGSQGNAQVTRNLVREGALGFQLLVMGYEGGDIATEECATKWAAANVKWNAISADSRAQVRTDAEFEDAWLRYQHWALANGSTPDAGVGSGLNTNNNLNLTATIIIGAIGLTTLVGYYFINKKKAHA